MQQHCFTLALPPFTVVVPKYAPGFVSKLRKAGLVWSYGTCVCESCLEHTVTSSIKQPSSAACASCLPTKHTELSSLPAEACLHCAQWKLELFLVVLPAFTGYATIYIVYQPDQADYMPRRSCMLHRPSSASHAACKCVLLLQDRSCLLFCKVKFLLTNTHT